MGFGLISCSGNKSQNDEDVDDSITEFRPGTGSNYVAYKLENDSVEFLSNEAVSNEFKIHVSKFADSRRAREANYETGQDAVNPNFAMDSLNFAKVYPLKLNAQNWYLVAEAKHQNNIEKMLIGVSLAWKKDSRMIDPAGTLYTCLVKNSCPDPKFKIVEGKINGFDLGQDPAAANCQPYISIQTQNAAEAEQKAKDAAKVDQERF